MFDDEQNTTSFWDTAASTASEAWDSASSAASGAWDTVSGAASGAWDTVSGVFGGSKQDEGPISVPVTPEQEAAAAKMVEESERMANDPNHRSPYEQEQDRKAQAEAAYQKREAERQAADPANEWSAALDKYIKGEGPSPGPRDEYIAKRNRQRQDADPHGPYSGLY